MLIRPIVLLLVAALMPLHTVEAQKSCKKGIPCGNSCIAANKVCRIGSPATDSSAAPKVDTARSQTKADTSASTTKTGTKVWVNTPTMVYHCPGTRWYGATKKGSYMTESAAKTAGARPANGKPCT